MNDTIEIANPDPGGRWYTSAKKAHDYIKRGRAYMDNGLLVFIHATHQQIRFEDTQFWNGSPKPKIMQKVNPRRILDMDCGPVIAMHKPGEVRS